jgi:hypothetical protein
MLSLEALGRLCINQKPPHDPDLERLAGLTGSRCAIHLTLPVLEVIRYFKHLIRVMMRAEKHKLLHVILLNKSP